MTRRFRTLMLVLAGLCLGQVEAGHAQEMRVGKIDMERIYAEYELFQKMSEEYRTLVVKLLKRIEMWKQRYPLLLQEEWSELNNLLEKTQLTEVERAKLDGLQKLNGDRDRELAELELLLERTTDQDRRYKELVQIRTQVQQGIQELTTRYQRELEERDAELTAQLRVKIDKAVEEIAAAQTLTVVVRADLVLFGGIDITAQVLQKLNAPEPPAAN